MEYKGYPLRLEFAKNPTPESKIQQNQAKRDKCFQCGDFGHIAKNCRVRYERNNFSMDENEYPPNVNYHRDPYAQPIPHGYYPVDSRFELSDSRYEYPPYPAHEFSRRHSGPAFDPRSRSPSKYDKPHHARNMRTSRDPREHEGTTRAPEAVYGRDPRMGGASAVAMRQDPYYRDFPPPIHEYDHPAMHGRQLLSRDRYYDRGMPMYPHEVRRESFSDNFGRDFAPDVRRRDPQMPREFVPRQERAGSIPNPSTRNIPSHHSPPRHELIQQGSPPRRRDPREYRPRN